MIAFPSQPDIKLEVIGQISSTPNVAVFAPHENEKVANDYVTQKVTKLGGVFVILRQNKERWIRDRKSVV